MTKSKKTSEGNKKQQHFFPHASRSLLCIRFVAVAFRFEEEVSWRRGPLWPIFTQPWIRHKADLAKNNKTCKGPWVLHPYQVSTKSIKRFWRRRRNAKKYGRRTTDGRTDDGRRAMTIAHSSLRLRWAKRPQKRIKKFDFGMEPKTTLHPSCF